MAAIAQTRAGTEIKTVVELFMPGHLDVALRDPGLALGAFLLALLSRGPGGRPGRV